MKKKNDDTYYLFTPDPSYNFHSKIYRPILTDEERERRMAEIKNAAAELLVSYYSNLARIEKEKGEA